MTSRERVRNTLEHKNTDRAPISYMILPPEVASAIQDRFSLNSYEEVLHFLKIDYRKLKAPFIQNPPAELKEEYRKTYNRTWPYTDIKKPYLPMPTFGIEDTASYSSSTVKRPFEMAESIEEIEKFPWPDPKWLDYESLSNEMKVHPDKAVIAPDWSPIFGSVCEFFGMETALMNLKLAPELVEVAVEKITDYYYERNKIVFEKCKGLFDICIMGDDFASDKGLMISLDSWKKFFRKPLKRLIDLAKSYGLKVHEHCCGAMSELIPEFIELGVDELEPCQFHLPGMSAERLSSEFGKHIIFFGGVNTQHTLSFGTPEDVRREVRSNLKIFKEGGYAVGSDHTMLPEFPLENILALYDEAQKIV